MGELEYIVLLFSSFGNNPMVDKHARQALGGELPKFQEDLR